MAKRYEFAVGSHVEVQTTFGEELMGEVFAFDKYTHTLVLKELAPSTTIRIINSDMIKSPGGVVELKRALTMGSPEPLPAVDPARSLKKEADAVKAAEAVAQKMGVGVTKEGQAIFEAIGKTMPVAWDDKTIVVLGEVRISEPYSTEDAACGPEAEATLKRVQLVIQAERQKLQNNGSL